MRIINKGISLISLIITMVVIAILAAVMIPSGVDKINNAKLTTFNTNVLTLKQETTGYFVESSQYPIKRDASDNPVIYSITTNAALLAEATKKGDQNDTFYIIDLDKLKLDNKDNGVGKTIDDYYILAKNSGNVYYAKGIKIGNITYYTKQDKGDGVVAVVPTSAPPPNGAFDGNLNSPKLSAGMTAVKWNGSAWVDADKSNKGNDWYDYTQGINKWANVKLVDGSMLVWIPRYTYKIISGEHTSTTGVIDVRFSIGIKDNTADGYRIHPAFYWGGWSISASAPMTKVAGGVEVTGIWVGKYEPSNNGGKIQIVPNVASWRSITVNDIFTTCRNMKNDTANYGDLSNADTHMMKNSEWGAVAYLSKYTLGATEVTKNSNSSYITANGDIVANKAQSTTGTEYGIYDMSGGSWEYMASYLNNGNDNLYTYGQSVMVADSRYKDILPAGVTDDSQGSYDAQKFAYGHAIYETSLEPSIYNGSSWTTVKRGWFDDAACIRYGPWPWVLRGGYYNENLAGLFAFYPANGSGAYASNGFRVVIVVI